MDRALRLQLIERYADGPRVVEEALDGITEAELDARPGGEDWTARQIVHHLADSEMTGTLRLRRLLAEDHPVLQGYDEMEFSRRPFYDRRRSARRWTRSRRPAAPRWTSCSTCATRTGRGRAPTPRAGATGWRRGCGPAIHCSSA